MSEYSTLRTLMSRARALQRLYCGRYPNPDEELSGLCISMARSAFIAHSVLAGYNRRLVHRIAERVYDETSSQHRVAA